jgi:hypothetical protein
MRGDKKQLVAMYFEGVEHLLPWELYWICLELSGLVKVCGKTHCVWWNIHVPRFIFSRDYHKWQRRRNQRG